MRKQSFTAVAVLALTWIATKSTCEAGDTTDEKGRAAVQPVARSGDRPQRAVNYTKLARSLVRYPNNPVLKVGEKGAWNDQTLGCFTVLDAGDTFYFYSGGAQYGKPKNIGMATSEDGGTFMSFDIIFRDGKFMFWYAAAATGHGDETKMTIQIGHGTRK